MKYSLLEFLVTMKAPYIGTSKLPYLRWVKYFGKNFLNAVNSFTFTFLITSKSLNDLINGLPDLPPEANQASDPPTLSINNSKDIFFFLLSC